MASGSHKHTKTESMLVNLAESIGSTLGTLAAKADAAQKALSNSDIASSIGRESKKLVRKSKALAGGAKRKAGRKVTGGKAAAARTAKTLTRKAARKAQSAGAAVRRTVKNAKRTAGRATKRRARK